MRCGDKKAGSLTYSILSDNWYVLALLPVEDEIRRVIRYVGAKDRLNTLIWFGGGACRSRVVAGVSAIGRSAPTFGRKRRMERGTPR